MICTPSIAGAKGKKKGPTALIGRKNLSRMPDLEVIFAGPSPG
jgi:hypothetical protein